MTGRLLFGWWRFSQDVVASLTHPRTDIATADADVRDAMRESRLFAFSGGTVAVVERAWRASVSRQVIERVSSVWQTWILEARVRAVGACIAVMMTTVLVLQTLESSLHGPLRWVFPAIVGLIGLAIAIAAAPIARACGGRRA
jgi:hypothetical protein